jgi:four helix bundle protein
MKKSRRKRRTSNIQRPTLNAAANKRTRNGERSTPNIEGRMLNGAAKKRTPNAQHRTSNIECGNGHFGRVKESPTRQYGKRAPYDLEDRLLEFAAKIVRLVEILPNTKAGNHVAGQLLRCGTSPLSNHGEVEAAESRKDFLHKLRICLKELRETKRWLRLVGRLNLVDVSDLGVCLNETEELIRIFVASVRTAERNAK